MNAKITGRITQPIEIVNLPSGKQVANVRIADNHTFRDREGKRQQRTSFHTIKIWNTVATALHRVAGVGDLVGFKINVQPHHYHSPKQNRVINELAMTGQSFEVLRQARANRTT